MPLRKKQTVAAKIGQAPPAPQYGRRQLQPQQHISQPAVPLGGGGLSFGRTNAERKARFAQERARDYQVHLQQQQYQGDMAPRNHHHGKMHAPAYAPYNPPGPPKSNYPPGPPGNDGYNHYDPGPNTGQRKAIEKREYAAALRQQVMQYKMSTANHTVNVELEY